MPVVNPSSSGGGSSAATSWVPSDSGLLAATYDPQRATSSTAASTGNIITSRVPVKAAVTVTNLLMFVQSESATLTGARGAIYKLNGTLIAQTASQTTGWASTGLKTMALTAEVGQSLVLPAADVIAAFWVAGGTVAMQGTPNGATALVNVGLSDPAYRSSATAGNVSLPTTLSGLGAFNAMIWAGLS